MSLTTLSAIAAHRDQGPPKRTKPKPKNEAEAEQAEDRTYPNILVSAIPTEPLALYTFLTGGLVATIDPGEDERLPMRWIIYAVMIGFIIVWLGVAYYRGRAKGDRTRKFPWAETLAAGFAFAAWGLVMPDSPLNAELSGDDRTVWTLIITAAGAGIVGVLGVSLKQPARQR